MPRKNINYDNTYFYKLCCKDLNIKKIYIGHTTNWDNRKNQHKKSCINPNSKEYNQYKYKFIRDNGNWNNWEMILIEKRKCNDKLDAEKIERQYIETFHAELNKNIPTKLKMLGKVEYYKQYWEENENKIKEYKKEYNKENENKIKEYKKEYYKENENKLKEQHKHYYEINKEKFNEKHICDCGGIYTYTHKARHEKSLKHQNYIKSTEFDKTSTH